MGGAVLVGGQVTVTRLVVTGATCEACSKAAVVSARTDTQTRYYCAAHIGLSLREIHFPR
jgi:hypothetical protein